MSDLITKGVLRYFGNIFGLARSGPRMLDLELPVITVLDVGRSAELGSGIGRADGWCCLDVEQVHAIAGTITTTTDLLAALVAALPGIYDPQQHLPWLIDTNAFTATTGIFTSAHMLTGEQTQGTNYQRLWRIWTGAVVATGADTGIPTNRWATPVPMYGATFNSFATGTVIGGATLIYRNLFWIGSRGSRAPFVA